MNRRILLGILLFPFCSVGFGQFKQNSIGICYLQKETSNAYFLIISLPYKTLEKESPQLGTEFNKVIDTLTYRGQIILFDSVGVIGRIDNKEKFLIEFWCDNDGGTQYRPTLKLTIKKNNLKSQLKGINEMQNICCFVLLNKNENKIEEPDFKISTDIKLKGDYNQDGKSDCFLWTYIDDAQNCDGEPKNNLGIMLQVGKEYYSLRCCGP